MIDMHSCLKLRTSSNVGIHHARSWRGSGIALTARVTALTDGRADRASAWADAGCSLSPQKPHESGAATGVRELALASEPK